MRMLIMNMNSILVVVSGILQLTAGAMHHKKQMSQFHTPSQYIDGNQCNRQCTGQRQSCYFEFNLEIFLTMSKACYNCRTNRSDCFRIDCIVGGGVSRTVQVINRSMPGPSIEVCEGDEIIVLFSNQLWDGASSTIHWHGINMYDSPYMDGVPYVTQCPTQYGNKFTYKFRADHAGTYWWHSHVGLQRGDGVYGSLIIRQTRERNKHAHLYDFDLSNHTIIIMDWNDRPTVDVNEENALSGASLLPTGILINGLGYQFNNNVTNTPLANYIIERGKKYRFRIINGAFFECPLEFSVEGHTMTIIATDGEDVEPVIVNSFVSSSGERFDFILHANQFESTYWITVKGYLLCEPLQDYTVATLKYERSSLDIPSSPIPTFADAAPHGGVLLNPINRIKAIGYSKVYGTDDLRGLIGIPTGFNTTNPFRFYISLDMNYIDDPRVQRYPYYGVYQVPQAFRVRTAQFNRITFQPPDMPLLSARYGLAERGIPYCNNKTMGERNCTQEFCACTHVLEVPLGAVVEMVLRANSVFPVLHPVHLHGHTFRVLACRDMGWNITMQELIDMDVQGQLERNFDNPPIKDTVTVSSGGYTIIRWIADNPGFWLLHCHVNIHSIEGMSLVVKVGNNNQMPDVPKNFPSCGNWPN